MNVQAILSIILALFCSLLITLSVCVQGNCSNTVKNHALQGKHFKRLYNIDWLACIQSCNVNRNCYSYNFCFSDSKIRLGTCELNDCWIQIQEDLWSKKSSLVFVQDCIFQQLPKAKKDDTACDKKNNRKNNARWIQAINPTRPICLETSINVNFFMPATGSIQSVRLQYASGKISCDKNVGRCAAFWGCACYKHNNQQTDSRIDIIITDHNSAKVFPDLKLPGNTGKSWYTLPNQINEQSLLTFPNLTQPLAVRNGDKFIVWYSSHLFDRGPEWSKAGGRVCFSVEVLFSQVDGLDPFSK